MIDGEVFNALRTLSLADVRPVRAPDESIGICIDQFAHCWQRLLRRLTTVRNMICTG